MIFRLFTLDHVGGWSCPGCLRKNQGSSKLLMTPLIDRNFEICAEKYHIVFGTVCENVKIGDMNA